MNFVEHFKSFIHMLCTFHRMKFHG